MINKSQTGIAFSDDGISFVKISRNIFGKFWLEDYKMLNIRDEAMTYGIVRNQEELVETLQKLKTKRKIKSAYISLPCEKENLSEDYIKDFQDILKEAKIKTKSFEAEGEAIKRAVLKKNDTDTYMLINIQNHHTSIYIVDEGKVVFSSLVEVGMRTFFEVKETTLEKENILSRKIIIGQVSSSLLSGLNILKDATSKVLIRWQGSIGKRDPKRPIIKKIILCGSGAGVKGVEEYLSVSLKMKTELANVWVNVFDTSENIPPLPFKESLSFAGAVGSAMKRFE